MASGGLFEVSKRALGHTLRSEGDMAAAEVAWLDDGHLLTLVRASLELADAAQDEYNGRQAAASGKERG